MLASLLPQGVDGTTALLLVLASFFTSALTAAFGIGGGVAMLGLMASTLNPAVIIAVHGVVQLGSNMGRAIIQRQHADKRLILQFIPGAVLGVALGAMLVTSVPERLLLGLLGGFILLVIYAPLPKITVLAQGGVFIGGVISSILTMFLGATGVFSKAMLLAFKLDRKTLIATDAVMMSIQHALKVVAFGFLGVALRDWLWLAAAMIASGFLGTVLGTRLLHALPERLFQVLIKGLLTLIALDILRRAAGF